MARIILVNINSEKKIDINHMNAVSVKMLGTGTYQVYSHSNEVGIEMCDCFTPIQLRIIDDCMMMMQIKKSPLVNERWHLSISYGASKKFQEISDKSDIRREICLLIANAIIVDCKLRDEALTREYGRGYPLKCEHTQHSLYKCINSIMDCSDLFQCHKELLASALNP